MTSPDVVVGKPLICLFKYRGIGKDAMLIVAEVVAGMYH